MTLLEPTRKVLGTEHAALEDSFAGAKEKAVLLIARELDAHSDEELNQIRRNISWTAQP